MVKNIELSVVLPCLNEEETIAICVKKARDTMKKHNIVGEVVVSDNGSTDQSVSLAKKAGARVVHAAQKGYGNAYHAGFKAAKGKYFMMADADDTYDLTQIHEFIQPLREGFDFVIGNRFKGNIEKGAMPPLHYYIGNPVLSGILRIMFNTSIGDSHCGIRAFTAEAYKKLNLHTSGMEFASEMVIRAVETNLKIKEIPTNLAVRGGGVPHLSSFRDGWRHLRFMLTYSPLWLYIIPALSLFIIGLLLLLTPVIRGPTAIGDLELDIHLMLVGAMFLILAYSVGLFGAFTKIYRAKILDVNGLTVDLIGKHVTIDRGIILGIALIVAGVAIEAFLLSQWASGALDAREGTMFGIIALVLIIYGFQTIFASFFLSILQIEHR